MFFSGSVVTKSTVGIFPASAVTFTWSISAPPTYFSHAGVIPSKAATFGSAAVQPVRIATRPTSTANKRTCFI